MRSLLSVAALLLLATVAQGFRGAPRVAAPRARLLKASVEDKPPEAKDAGSLPPTMGGTMGKEMIYDRRTGRFYEFVPSADGAVGGATASSDAPEEFTVRDDKGNDVNLTLEEKERIFLDALQSYYVSGRQMLNDADFDMLKEDLMWQGSRTVMLSREETLFLSAVSAYLRGEPILSDKDFDALKNKLREENSVIAVSKEPRCYVDTGVCTIRWSEDTLRQSSLYMPTAFVMTVAWLAGAYELVPFFRSINPLFLYFIGSPLIYGVTKTFTEGVLARNAKLAGGPCPSCNAEQRTYFGSLLMVDGPETEARFKCSNCKAELIVQRDTLRCATLPKAEEVAAA